MPPRTKTLKPPSIENRFRFHGDALAAGDRATLKSTLYEVEDLATGAPRTLRLWRKTGTAADDDLRVLWRHEMRQVQRIMSYAGARDVIVDILEFVEDSEHFGVLLERTGQPLAVKRARVTRNHWLETLNAVRSRTLFWKNMQRVVAGLGLIHAQGLVHGNLSADVIMTEGAEEPDFQLGGFEWSLWVGADTSDKSHATVASTAAPQRYSFSEDWRALGATITDCFGLAIDPSGNVGPKTGAQPATLSTSERRFLNLLARPSRYDLLDAPSVARSIDEIITSIGRSSIVQSGTFVLQLDRYDRLGAAIYDCTSGQIAIDDLAAQLDWVGADLGSGAKLLVPKEFDPSTGKLRIITNAMVYRLKPSYRDGSAVWDTAVCFEVFPRDGAKRLWFDQDHTIDQPILVARHAGHAQDIRSSLGPALLDWSILAGARAAPPAATRSDHVRRSLVLIQVCEAVVKALEYYPLEILHTFRREGRRIALVRAQPNNDRDTIAKKVGLTDSATALKRLFEEDARDGEGKWKITQSPGLGSRRAASTTATFVDIQQHKGRQCYQFELDDELPPQGPFFLRTERDSGTETVIRRRLRNIKALDTRIDLADMLDDPWRMRRSSREILTEEDQEDAAFKRLDKPKREALMGLWSTLPSYFVVGPPGVGKTKLATEIIRRRFSADHSTRILVSAQAHDALDHLQAKILETLKDANLTDVVVARSTTRDDRPTSDEEAHLLGLRYLQDLSQSTAFAEAPIALQNRIAALKAAGTAIAQGEEAKAPEDRAGLHAVSNLVVDGANIVLTTTNSSDIEDLVETRAQFDWVIVEEAAKATGPELVGALMLSGRRLLIGDHHQLPPFDAKRLATVLADHTLLAACLDAASDLTPGLLRDGELDEMQRIAGNADQLTAVRDLALRLLEPFRAFVEEDERKAHANDTHRPISTMLTEQWRMDPAIARIISHGFYSGKLETANDRIEEATTTEPPFVHTAGLPASPVIVIDFKHVSASGHKQPMERNRPRWHNKLEADAVLAVLRGIRARTGCSPTLAVLSPYKAQVDHLARRIQALRNGELAHLDQFTSVRTGGGFVGTVDSFQGNEADLVIVSLVRNNPRAGAGALGFLRDRRRINVAFSRPKLQLVLVGSLAFLREAVRGVNPDDKPGELSFLTRIAQAIDQLSTERRGDLPLATLISPDTLQRP